MDIATNTVVVTIPDISAYEVAITPDGTRAYAAGGFGPGPISVIETASNSVVATIPVGGNAVAITPNVTRAYVTNAENPGTVSVIDTATNSLVATIPIEGQPIAVAITPAQKTPKSKQECMQGGYLKFGPPAGPFKNQGQRVSYVEHH